MAYAIGLDEGRPAPAGIVGLSGFMPTVEGFTPDLADRSALTVAIGHGSRDPVIGVEWGRQARDRLREARAEVAYEEHPGGHQIDPGLLGKLPAWVAGAVGTRTG